MTQRTTIVRRQRAGAARPTQRPLKLVVTGPFAAGKTSLIQTISEVAVVGTERDVTDDTRAVKTRTTVAMDFGRLSFGDDLALFLFGTPGQRRFEVMWEVLSEGMLGFILLVNAADERSLEESGHILETFRRYADVPFAIGVTHLDETDEPADVVLARVHDRLAATDSVAVTPCDPRSREDVKGLMIAILVGVLERLDRTEPSA